MSKASIPESIANHIEDLLLNEALNTLSTEEEKELKSYLLCYPELAEHRREIQSIMGLLAHAAPFVPASPQLKENILRQAQSPPIQPDLYFAGNASVENPRLMAIQHRVAKLIPSVPSNVSWGLAMAASFLLVALSLDNINLRRQMRVDQEQITVLTAEIDHLVEYHSDVFAFNLTGTPVVGSATGSVILDFEAQQATLAIKNLPVATDNLAYHLWAFTEKGEKIFCGRFQAEANGVTLAHIPIDPDIYTSEIEFLRISREPAVTPFQPDKRVLVMTSES